MICILAASYANARQWAKAQHLSDKEWFCPQDVSDIYDKQDFHVVVLETASDLPPIQFERLFNLAQQRGRINRHD